LVFLGFFESLHRILESFHAVDGEHEDEAVSIVLPQAIQRHEIFLA